MTFFRLSPLLLLTCLFGVASVIAQAPPSPASGDSGNFGVDLSPLGGQGGLGGGGFGGGEHVQLMARYELHEEGRRGRLIVSGIMEEDWHVYSVTQQPGGPMRSNIGLSTTSDEQAELLGEPSPNEPPEVRNLDIYDVPVEEHYEQVTWTIPLELVEDVDPEQTSLEVKYSGQVCHDTKGCIPVNETLTAKFAGRYTPTPEELQALEGGKQAEQFDLAQLQVQDDTQNRSFIAVMGLALLGGFILNFMPCVLPVIGLKVLSFVQQAGENRARAFLLNVWYAAGLLSVFMVLAALAAALNFGWGQQNSIPAFNIVMAAVVFVMGLSFLGVWEIPIPGFVGGGATAKLAEREGAAGAFSKGVVTTILAVPCSGPALATAVAWAQKQPAAIIFLAFAMMGVGMALPYLIIGANPRLVKFIPKPGPWMETFKQVMGFVLLATVLWIFTYIQWTHWLPTLTLLFGLWAACWWIGRMPVGAGAQEKLRHWAGAIAFSAAVGLFSFMWLEDVMELRFAERVDAEIADRQVAITTTNASAGEAEPQKSQHELPWEPFSTEKLSSLVGGGQTVLVDFTADWCLTCKTLERTVLNTQDVRQVVDQQKVATLVADWTDSDPEITQMLQSLGSKQVPVVAIFPAGRPNEPYVFRGWYTQGQLLEKLEAATGSKAAATTAMK